MLSGPEVDSAREDTDAQLSSRRSSRARATGQSSDPGSFARPEGEGKDDEGRSICRASVMTLLASQHLSPFEQEGQAFPAQGDVLETLQSRSCASLLGFEVFHLRRPLGRRGRQGGFDKLGCLLAIVALLGHSCRFLLGKLTFEGQDLDLFFS